ncbi:MAG: proline racemase family protein [Steroidobacterales bacterium]
MGTKYARVVDSHTAGEPTRVVTEGGPELGTGSMAQRLERFRADFDHYRAGIVNEPRGSNVIVGALLCEPEDPTCAAGVVFFNNVGFIGMCGHGTIGLVVTLAHLGRIQPGVHRIETPVGVVTAELHDRTRVTVSNVPSYRFAHRVEVDVPGYGAVTGDVAWGGNWFFLVETPGLAVTADRIDVLTEFSWRARQALAAKGIGGENGAEIDHVEVFGPPSTPQTDSRSFVLCPGGAYDRSPCGTGTSAKLACLHADGKLGPGDVWRQESVIGTTFEASFSVDDRHPGRVLPRITGTAHVTAEATLFFDDADPLRWGIDPRG